MTALHLAHSIVAVLGQQDFVTGGQQLADAVRTVLITIVGVVGLILIIAVFRRSEGLWGPVLGAVALTAIVLFFVANTGVLDPIIRATVKRFWG